MQMGDTAVPQPTSIPSSFWSVTHVWQVSQDAPPYEASQEHTATEVLLSIVSTQNSGETQTSSSLPLPSGLVVSFTSEHTVAFISTVPLATCHAIDPSYFGVPQKVSNVVSTQTSVDDSQW